MPETPEEILAQIKQLEQGPESVRSKVKLFALHRRYRELTGEDPPPAASSDSGISIANFHITGANPTVAIGDGAVAIGEVNHRIESDTRARTGEEPSPDDRNIYPSPLCLVEALDATGTPLQSGTGFLIAPRLILTCRHVLPEDPSECHELIFRFSGERIHSNPPGGPECWFSHRLEVKAMRDNQTLRTWCESPPFRSRDDYLAGNRDLVLLQADPNTELWGVSVDADFEHLKSLNCAGLLMRKVAPVDPVACHQAVFDPAREFGVILARRGPEGALRQSPGQTLFNDDLWWHTCADPEHGDSGAPLVTEDGEIVGMHTSAAELAGKGRLGRFVPVAEIRGRLNRSRDLHTSDHAANLRKLNWLD